MKQNSSTEKSKNRGFTLVELIVVIAILAILSAVGAVAYTGYIEYTKKGLDKQTVGEIMHAIELANYDDTSLFENPVTVFISGPEGNGTTSLNTDIDNALSNALGDLTTVKVSEKSVGDPAAILTALSSNSRYNDYITAAKGGAKATFADDVFGLWDSVVEAKTNFASPRKDFLNLAVQYANNYGTGNESPAFDNWKNGKAIDDMGPEDGQAVSLARNYCFAVYAAKQDLTPAMQKQLQDFINGGYGLYGAAGLHTKFFGDIFDEDEEGHSTKSAWDQIVTAYEKEQADIDVKAYLALMAATEAIDPTGTMQDDEIMGEMNKVLGSLDAIMRDPDNAETIKSTIIEKCATITVIKNPDGTLTMKPYPEDLNPRDENNSGGSSSGKEESEGCSKNHTSTVEVTLGGSPTNGTLQLKNNGSLTDTIELCLIDNNCPSCTLSYSSAHFETGSISISGTSDVIKVEGNTITALKSGTATVTITVTVKNALSSYVKVTNNPITVTVNVH